MRGRVMTPLEALLSIVLEYGNRATMYHMRIVRSLLRDRCHEAVHQRDIDLLVLVGIHGAPRVLAQATDAASIEQAVSELARSLSSEYGLVDAHARSAVRTWALALAVSTDPITNPRRSAPIRLAGQERAPPLSAVRGPGRLVVDAAGGGNYATIGSAYADARAGEIIVVHPGTYRETLRIDRDVQIVGNGGRSTVIVEGAPGAGVFTLSGGSPALTGLTIRVVGTCPDGQPAITGAISVTAGTPVIEDCDITSSAGSAVYIFGLTADPTFRNCTMRDSCRDGINVSDEGQGTIEKCEISGNARAGITKTKGGNTVIRDCEIHLNGFRGVWVHGQGSGTFTGNRLTGNIGGAWVIDADSVKVLRTGNTPNE